MRFSIEHSFETVCVPDNLVLQILGVIFGRLQKVKFFVELLLIPHDLCDVFEADESIQIEVLSHVEVVDGGLEPIIHLRSGALGREVRDALIQKRHGRLDLLQLFAKVEIS